eukprot:COSAG05_NODE_1788_length_4087_cov_3.154425_4_plen_52_part_00
MVICSQFKSTETDNDTVSGSIFVTLCTLVHNEMVPQPPRKPPALSNVRKST